MRDIKLRVWDKVMNRLISLEAIYFDGDKLGVKTGEEIDGDWTVLKRESLILMQYVGLEDKKGVEIYEGDIISSPNMDGEVIFRRGSFQIRDRYGNHKSIINISNPEVIGNIFRRQTTENAKE